MKSTAGRRSAGIRKLARGNRTGGLNPWGGERDGSEQSFGVRMDRRRTDGRRAADLYNLSQIHHGQPITDVPYHRDIVSDEEHRQIQLLLKFHQEINLTLHLDELEPMIDFLNPTWIVPMHYNLPPITAGMTTVDVFLKRRPRDPVIFARHHTVTFPLPSAGLGRPSIVVLEPSAYQPV